MPAPSTKPPTRQPLSARAGKKSPVWNFPFVRENFLYFGAGLAVVILGFLLLAVSVWTSWDNPLSVSVAPVVLLVGYCVIIPVGIMKYFKDRKGTE